MGARKCLPKPAPPPLSTENDLFLIVESFLQKTEKPLLAIVGSTASGKTDISLRVAKRFRGEVINADSRQFYKGMSIGTAKITEKEKNEIPHHLIDFLNPNEECPVAIYVKLAKEKISLIQKRGNTPLLVGGSGLFVDALRKGFSIPHVAPQKEFRAECESISTEELFQSLQQKDEKTAMIVEPKNRRRIIRALEVFQSAGKPLSLVKGIDEPPFTTLLIGVWQEPHVLEKRIAERTEKMWQCGFLNEVRSLLDAGYNELSPAFMAHGYREAVEYLKGNVTEEEAKRLMTRNTRRYAKRQRTWWRKEKNIIWIQPSENVVFASVAALK